MPHTVLHIDASARHQDSQSRLASSRIVADLEADKLVRRDLVNDVPLLDEGFVTGTFVPPEARTAAQIEALTPSDQFVSELMQADTIVIGTPMYNFSIPAALKAWIDQIARVGVTFTYTENGPKGLLEDKKAIVTIATGGVTLGSAADFASDYLRFVLGFVGITDVTVLDSDGKEIAARTTAHAA